MMQRSRHALRPRCSMMPMSAVFESSSIPFKGIVTLSGRVKSPVEHDQAIAIARHTSGVVSVKDGLQVIPEGQAQ